MTDTAKLIAQAREYAAHRDDPKRGQPPWQSELFLALADALEAAHAEVENRRLREALQEIAACEDDCIHQRQARAALAGSGE